MEAPPLPPPSNMAHDATDTLTQAYGAMEAPAPPPPSVMAHGAMGTPAQTPPSNVKNAADAPADAPVPSQEGTVPHIFAPLGLGTSQAPVAAQPAQPSHANHVTRRNADCSRYGEVEDQRVPMCPC